jgi:hypothetical protein
MGLRIATVVGLLRWSTPWWRTILLKSTGKGNVYAQERGRSFSSQDAGFS